MPDRYHGQRVQPSLIVQLTNRELLDRASRSGKRLAWHNLGLALAKFRIPAARDTANAEQAEGHLQISVPRELTSVSPLPAAFSRESVFPVAAKIDEDASSVETSTERAGERSSDDSSSDSGAAQCSQLLPAGASSSSQTRPGLDEVSVKLADHSWQAMKFHGQLHVHFISSGMEYPACKRKRGVADRQALNRVNAQSDDVKDVRNFLPVGFCKGCPQSLRISEDSVRRFIESHEQ